MKKIIVMAITMFLVTSENYAGFGETIETTATKLYAEFEKNELAADEYYKGKTIIINGKIKEIKKDFLGQAYVNLDAGAPIGSVGCKFPKSEISNLIKLSKGDNAKFECAAVEGKTILSVFLSGCVVKNATKDWSYVDWSTISIYDLQAKIKMGADVNAKGGIFGGTPLHSAAWFNENPDIIKALIAAGADVKAKNKNGETPLHSAAQNKNPDIIKALIAAGADVNAKGGIFGGTPLRYAAWFNKNPDIIKALIAAGADVNTKGEYGKTPSDSLQDNNKLTSTQKAQIKRWLQNPNLVR